MQSKRNTIQKQLVYNAVEELNIHATAEQVFEHVVRKHPSISKATVYRNLSQMADSGELLNIGNHHGSTHYDHNCHEHYHFICDNCKWVYDIDAPLPNIYEAVTGMDGFEIKSHNLTFSGLCRDCSNGHL